MTRQRERGSAMLVTLIVIAALLAGASVLVSMQLASTRGGGMDRTGMSALYCAEAGLEAALPVVQANYSAPGSPTGWGQALAASAPAPYGAGILTEPPWLYSGINGANPYGHDLDGDHVDDFSVYLKDNSNDDAPSADDPATDEDLRIFIVSTCTKYPDQPVQVQELIKYDNATGHSYTHQLGGAYGQGQ